MNRTISNNNDYTSSVGTATDKTQTYPSATATTTTTTVTNTNTTAIRTPSLRPFSTPKANVLKTNPQQQPLPPAAATINRTTAPSNRPPIYKDGDRKQQTTEETEGNPILLTGTTSQSQHEPETKSTPDLFQEMKFQEITTETVSAAFDSREFNNKKIIKDEAVGKERHRLRRSCSNLSQLIVEDGVVIDEKKSGITLNTKNATNASKLREEPSMMKDFTTSSKELKSSYLMRPCPRSYGMVRCYVKRTRSAANSFLPEYSVFLKEDDVELMSSKRNPYKATSNYVIRINPTGDILGKIRSNILSSEYTIYDCRSLCRQQQQQQQQQIEQRPSVVDSEGALRAELGAVIYRKVPSYDATTASCIPPRKMQVCINSLGGGSDISTPQSYKKPKTRAEEMLQLLKYKLDTAKRNFSVLESRIPNWDDNLEAYVLNFGGRVTMESQKNFQLVQADTVKEQIVVLQFGRVAKDEFTMDFRWPLSPFLAFALSLTACDSKVGRD